MRRLAMYVVTTCAIAAGLYQRDARELTGKEFPKRAASVTGRVPGATAGRDRRRGTAGSAGTSPIPVASGCD